MFDITIYSKGSKHAGAKYLYENLIDSFDNKKDITAYYLGSDSKVSNVYKEVRMNEYICSQAIDTAFHIKNREITGKNYKALENAMAGIVRGEKVLKVSDAEHTPGADFTFSVPKSVSVLFSQVSKENQDKLLKALDEAVKESFKYTKNYLNSRKGAGGSEDIDGDFLAGKFIHFDSRAGDPQLHAHISIANCMLCDDGVWRTIDFSKILNGEVRHTIGAVFRNELARNLVALGLDIELTGKTDNENEFFEIKGIDKHVMERMSKRSKEIMKTQQELIDKIENRYSNVINVVIRSEKYGNDDERRFKLVERLSQRKKKTLHKLEHKSTKDYIALNSRKTKNKDLKVESMMEMWDVELSKAGFTKAVAAGFFQERKGKVENVVKNYKDIVNEILTDKKVMFTAQELEKKLFQEFCGTKSMGQIKRLKQKILNDKSLVQLSYDKEKKALGYTSIEQIELSNDNLVVAKRMATADNNIGFTRKDAGRYFIEMAKNNVKFMHEEQKQAFLFLTENPAKLKIVVGKPGTGKTWILEQVSKALATKDVQFYGCAIAAKTAKNLEQETGIKSFTIDKILTDSANEKLAIPKNITLVIDEAGMIGTKKWNQLMSLAEEHNWNVIAVGDPKQIASVNVGMPIKDILDSDYGASISMELSNIQRQKTAELQSVAQSAAKLAVDEVFKKLQDFNIIQVKENDNDVLESIAADFLADTHTSKIMIAQTNEQCFKLNEMVRKHYKEAGLVSGEEVTITNEVNGEVIEQVVSVGDTIRFTKNDRKLKVSNGDTGRIRAIQETNSGYSILVEVEGGKIVKLNTSDTENNRAIFKLNYAITDYASQGQSIDSVYAIASDGKLANAETLNVKLTRCKLAQKVYITKEDYEDFDSIYNRKQHKIAANQLQDVSEEVEAIAAEVVEQNGTSSDFINKLVEDTEIELGDKKDSDNKKVSIELFERTASLLVSQVDVPDEEDQEDENFLELDSDEEFTISNHYFKPEEEPVLIKEVLSDTEIEESLILDYFEKYNIFVAGDNDSIAALALDNKKEFIEKFRLSSHEFPFELKHHIIAKKRSNYEEYYFVKVNEVELSEFEDLAEKHAINTIPSINEIEQIAGQDFHGKICPRILEMRNKLSIGEGFNNTFEMLSDKFSQRIGNHIFFLFKEKANGEYAVGRTTIDEYANYNRVKNGIPASVKPIRIDDLETINYKNHGITR